MKSNFVLPLYKFNSLDVYGPKIWYVLHVLALGYTPHAKLLYHPYRAFVAAIKELLPCQMCRVHFAANLIKYDLEKYLSNSSAIFLWTYLIHNEVNEKNRKTSPSYSTCFNNVKSQLNSMEIIPNLFFTLFTLAMYNPTHEKIGYLIMLITALRYLVPTEKLRKVFTTATERYKNINFVSTPTLYWIYLIYKDVHEALGIHYYSYTVILEYFLVKK